MKKLWSLILIVGLILTLSTSVFAQGSADKDTESRKGGNISLDKLPVKERELILERSKVVESYIMEIEKAHANLKMLNDQLSKVDSTSDRNALFAKIKAAEVALTNAQNNTEKYGLVKLKPVEETNEVSPLSIQGDYQITENYIMWDSAVGKYLYHTAGNWINTNWKNDYTCYVCTTGWKDIGGKDGYYLASLHKEINIYNPKFYTLNSSDWTITNDWSNTANTYATSNGFGWGFQDKIKLTPGPVAVDFNADRQLGWFWFDFVGGKPTGQTISFKVDVGHSWSNTSLNGIGLGPYSFSFSWSVNSDNWNKAALTTYTF